MGRPRAPLLICYCPVPRLRDGGQQFMRVIKRTWVRTVHLVSYILEDLQARWTHSVLKLGRKLLIRELKFVDHSAYCTLN